MDFLKKKVDLWIRLYSVIPLISVFTFNCLIYWGTMALTENRYHFDFTTELDRKVPLLPWTILIYLGCYLFWIVNYILTGHLKKEEFYRFITADLMSRMICGLIFLVLPTTNVRPELPSDSIFTPMMQWLWNTDQAANLFPSIHCLVSWMCFIGIRGKHQFPRWYRWFSCVFAVAVFLSTQTTKQHYLVDVIGGVALAEGCFWVAHHTELYQKVMRIFEAVNHKIWKEDKGCVPGSAAENKEG